MFANTHAHSLDSGTLTINVLDVNDHKPKFNQASYTVAIQENPATNSVLKMVSTDQMNVSDSDTVRNRYISHVVGLCVCARACVCMCVCVCVCGCLSLCLSVGRRVGGFICIVCA